MTEPLSSFPPPVQGSRSIWRSGISPRSCSCCSSGVRRWPRRFPLSRALKAQTRSRATVETIRQKIIRQVLSTNKNLPIKPDNEKTYEFWKTASVSPVIQWDTIRYNRIQQDTMRYDKTLLLFFRWNLYCVLRCLHSRNTQIRHQNYANSLSVDILLRKNTTTYNIKKKKKKKKNGKCWAP